MWRIALDEQRVAFGFFPEDYQGKLPDVPLIEVDDAEKERVFAMLPAYYDETDKTFKPWMPPPSTLAELKERKRAKIAAARYENETGGFDFNGVKIATDRGSQALLTAAVVTARFDPEFKTKWKCDNGQFVMLDAMQLLAIGDAVTAFIEGCFAREAELCELVDVAQNQEDLDAIEISF